MPLPRLPTEPKLAQRTLAIVMAGGNGTRLGALTRFESKPALPFGGQYRHIDFPLSNCVNSGIRRIAIATQYRPQSLIRHVRLGWMSSCPEAGESIDLWPAQQRSRIGWYSGTADAIYQNLDLIEQQAPDYVFVLAGDHVYKMDYGLMLREHVAARADATIGCVEVPIEHSSGFGVMATDEQGWVTHFDEKPVAARASPTNSGVALASMGIYVFNRAFLAECLRADAADSGSRHDFGRNILPALIGVARVLAHSFREQGGPAYWRDVGTIDSYWTANMELLAEKPKLDFRDDSWPIRTHEVQRPPPVFSGKGCASRSIVAGGCCIAGAVEHSVISHGCTIGPGSVVESTVVLPGVTIGRDCRIRTAIVETGCDIPDGTEIGGNVSDDTELQQRSAQRIALITSESISTSTNAVSENKREGRSLIRGDATRHTVASSPQSNR